MNDNSELLQFTASVDDNNDLVLTSALSFQLPDDFISILQALTVLVDNDPAVADAFANITTVAEFEQALLSLSPEVSAAIHMATMSVGRSAVVTILNRLAATRSGYGDMTGLAAGDRFENVTAWVQGFGSTADQRNRGLYNGYDFDNKGVTFGLDSLVTDDLRLGAAFSYASTDVKTKVLNNKTNIDSYQGSVYASLNKAEWYLDGSLSYGWNNAKGRRRITIGALNRTAMADYDSNQFIAQGILGRDYKLDNDVIVNPYVGLEYINLSTDNYTETGAGSLNLTVRSADTASLTSTLGVSVRKAIKTANDYVVTPEVHAGWRYDFLDETQLNNSTFAGGGAAFNTRGLNPADSGINIGASLSAYSSGKMELQARYDFEYKPDYTSHAGTLIFRYRF